MKHNNKIVLNKKIVIISTILVVLCVFGISLAYFMAVGESSEFTVTTANLEITFDDGTAIVNASNIVPIYTDEVSERATKKTFSISRPDTSSDIYAKIELTSITIPEALADYDFKWALYQDTTPVATGDFGGKTSGDIVLATNQLIDSTTAKTYNLYIWINETMLDQTDMMNQTFKATVLVSGTDKKENTLASKILGEDNANVITTAPTFSTSSTDVGLYVQKDDIEKSEIGFPTYYYRGAVTNNYVSFGTYASDITNSIWDNTSSYNYVDATVAEEGDPIIWRIVRVNEDGSIRLVTENNISSYHVWNSQGVANYVNATSGESDTIKDVVENWYDTNIGNNNTLDSKVITSSFCNDISGNYNAAYTRLYTNTPTPIFTCSSGAITAYEKVGMITADELVYSGIASNWVSSNIPYISNSREFWTLTPTAFNAAFIGKPEITEPTDSIHNTMLSPNDGSTVEVALASPRIVINLSPDVIVSGGNGSSGTPYTIK